jgi:hypothetical protein
MIMLAAIALSGSALLACVAGPEDTEQDEFTVTRFEQDAELTLKPTELPPGGPTTQATASFTRTCRAPEGWVVQSSTGAIVFAFSDGGCRRFNGTFGGPTAWSGTCFGDVSNCNGRIVCQNHCP